MNTKQLQPSSYIDNSNEIKRIDFFLIDKAGAILIILLLSPVMLLNIILSKFMKRSTFISTLKVDALGHHVFIRKFSCGIAIKSACFIDIFQGRLSLCGTPLTHSLPLQSRTHLNNNYKCRPGTLSLYDLHKKTGLAINDPHSLLTEQFSYNHFEYTGLIIKSLFCWCFFSNKRLTSKHKLTLFGITLSNTSMSDAIAWATATNKTTQLGFFINVNSINISFSQPCFKNTLAKADTLLVDGSGMRLAAKSAGVLLKDNTNGTDMLPLLCESCVKQSKSLYFLGSEDGVASKASSNLRKLYPGLNVVGTHHGYLSSRESERQIQKINESGCDILLVAMGSPFQEQWLVDNRKNLKCNTALAVGGLFDFYSGNIKRSPLFMREIGLEWLWRLSQEPIKKFHRYIVGTPLFLYRTYVLGLANEGEK